MMTMSNVLRRARWVMAVGILLLPLPSGCILEGLCSAPGYTNVQSGDSEEGPRDVGWDRIEPHNIKWFKTLWAAPATNGLQQQPAPIQFYFFYVNVSSTTLDGHVLVEYKADVSNKRKYLQTAVVWAVDEYNQAYGEVFKLNRYLNAEQQQHCPASPSSFEAFNIDEESFQWNLPCGAAPSPSPTVPGMVIAMAMMKGQYGSTRYENELKFSPSENEWRKNYSLVRLLWRAPAQTYCYRPKKFRFMIAVTAEEPWFDWYKNQFPSGGTPTNPKPTTMLDTKRLGFRLFTSKWIFPKYFGIPSRVDLDHRKPTLCMATGGYIGGTRSKPDKFENWVEKTASSTLEGEWTSDGPWGTGSSPNWNNGDVKKRSTCKSADPSSKDIQPFRGRCEKRLDKSKIFVGGLDNQMTCDDAGSSLGQPEFKEEYRDHLNRLERWLQADCECLQSVKGAVQHYKNKVVDMFKSDSDDGDDDEDFLAPVKYAHKVKPIRRRSIAHRPSWDRCPTSEMKDSELDKAGLCIYDGAGIVTYGVRQWHGIASLVQTFICTAVSITVARYCKGDVRLTRGRLPIRGWYMTHMLKLTAPTLWMWATGTFAMTRQTEVVGRSYTHAANVHRTLGKIAFALFWVNFISGFLRPINRRARCVAIHVHWWGGLLQHVLELYLCFNSYQIPGSPSQRFSYLNMSFRLLWQQRLPVFVFTWIISSFILHILMTSRQARVDMARHGKYRCMFPIIRPFVKMTTREERRRGRAQRRRQIEDRLKEMDREQMELERRKAEGPWRRDDEVIYEEAIQRRQREEQAFAEELEGMERNEDDDANEEEEMDYLLKLMVYFYGFGCVVMVAVSVVSLYQEHSDYHYYGLGPMTCTHYPNLTLKNPWDKNPLPHC